MLPNLLDSFNDERYFMLVDKVIDIDSCPPSHLERWGIREKVLIISMLFVRTRMISQRYRRHKDLRNYNHLYPGYQNVIKESKDEIAV
jgi:hypothetical protein